MILVILNGKYNVLLLIIIIFKQSMNIYIT